MSETRRREPIRAKICIFNFTFIIALHVYPYAVRMFSVPKSCFCGFCSTYFDQHICSTYSHLSLTFQTTLYRHNCHLMGNAEKLLIFFCTYANIVNPKPFVLMLIIFNQCKNSHIMYLFTYINFTDYISENGVVMSKLNQVSYHLFKCSDILISFFTSHKSSGSAPACLLCRHCKRTLHMAAGVMLLVMWVTWQFDL